MPTETAPNFKTLTPSWPRNELVVALPSVNTLAIQDDLQWGLAKAMEVLSSTRKLPAKNQPGGSTPSPTCLSYRLAGKAPSLQPERLTASDPVPGYGTLLISGARRRRPEYRSYQGLDFLDGVIELKGEPHQVHTFEFAMFLQENGPCRVGD
jgi:hypothetical protein